jgi:hypothetical protein
MVKSRPSFGFQLNATASNAIIADLDHAYMSLMKNKSAATVSGSPNVDSRGMSYFGRLNYNYDERYMFTAIFRADGSSIFAPATAGLLPFVLCRLGGEQREVLGTSWQCLRLLQAARRMGSER